MPKALPLAVPTPRELSESLMRIQSKWHAALYTAVLSAMFGILAQSTIAAPKGARWGPNYFPNVEVVDQHGKTYNFYKDLVENKTVVINFIYARCDDICPLTTARMVEVYKRLDGRVGKDIHFYSITLDPERDTPEDMKQHATAYNTGPGWLFLTGHPNDIHRLRYKLGERSRTLEEHQAYAVLGNDKRGYWRRSSTMSEYDRLAMSILSLEKDWRPSMYKGVKSYADADLYSLGKLPGASLFKKACASCHTVGKGDKIGPDLKGVTERREAGWLFRYMKNPTAMRAAKDPIAMELNSKYKGARMPDLSLAKEDITDLVAYFTAMTERLKQVAAKTEADTMEHRGSHRGSHKGSHRGSHRGSQKGSEKTPGKDS